MSHENIIVQKFHEFTNYLLYFRRILYHLIINACKWRNKSINLNLRIDKSMELFNNFDSIINAVVYLDFSGTNFNNSVIIFWETCCLYINDNINRSAFVFAINPVACYFWLCLKKWMIILNTFLSLISWPSLLIGFDCIRGNYLWVILNSTDRFRNWDRLLGQDRRICRSSTVQFRHLNIIITQDLILNELHVYYVLAWVCKVLLEVKGPR